MASDDAKENLMKLVSDGHYDMAISAHHIFKETYPEAYLDLKDELASLYHFFNDTPSDDFNQLMTALYRDVYALDEKEALLNVDPSEMTGLQLANPSNENFMVFLPDPSEKGRVRYSEFNKNGFFSHFTQDEYAPLIEEAWNMGYRIRTSNKLETLSMQPEWSSGSKEVLLIQQYNQGSISINEMFESMPPRPKK
jgi:hypothetical protein